MSNRLETAIKASAAEARLTKQKVLKELKQRMEGLIQQIENDRLWISDLKELHNQVAETVAKVTAADEKIKTEELFKLIERAEKWLRENTYTTKILKWETKQWGEIPADFGRK